MEKVLESIIRNSPIILKYNIDRYIEILLNY